MEACTAVRHDNEGGDASVGGRPTASRRVWAFPREPYLLVVLVACCALLAQFFPLSGDDWAWGSALGLDRLHSHFAGYNGRWAGNLAILALSRSPLLAPLVVAVTLCSIVFLMTRISGMRNLAGYGTALAMVMLMPLGTWRQAVVWLSGFSNYALSTVGLLVFVLMTQHAWRGHEYARPRLAAALTFPLAVVSALFVEHVTVALVVFSVLALVLMSRRHRPWRVAAAWAVGSITGAIVMFSNAAYRNVAGGTSSYQRVDDAGVGAIVQNALGGVSHLAVAANLGLNTCVFAAVGVLAWQAHSRTGRLTRGALASVVGASMGLVGGACVSAVAPAGARTDGIIDWSWVSSLGMLVAIVCAAIFLVVDVERRELILALLALVVVLIAPAAIMRPYGPRNFLPTYVLLAVILLVLVREVMGQEARTELKTVVAALGFGTATLVFAGHVAVYAHIDHVDQKRLEAIRTAVAEGKQQVSVPPLPHRGYVHQPNPVNDRFMGRFKRFHHVPDSVRLDFVR